MKLISEPAPGYPYTKEKRTEYVTRKEWEIMFSTFPSNVRYHMANLAAHNWHIVFDGYRVAALTPSSYNGHWMFEDGSRVDMTIEEENEFFPIVGDEFQYESGYVKVYPSKPDWGKYVPAVIRQRQIVIPERTENE